MNIPSIDELFQPTGILSESASVDTNIGQMSKKFSLMEVNIQDEYVTDSNEHNYIDDLLKMPHKKSDDGFVDLISMSPAKN
jgi:hypothetical protein